LNAYESIKGSIIVPWTIISLADSMDPSCATVSILMLTHNAPEYVELSIVSITQTVDVNYELVVVDNASDAETRHIVTTLFSRGLINRLTFLNYNSLFAEGNNIAARVARQDATHYLLLNSDVEIRHPYWLANLLHHHKRGVTAYGVAFNHVPRADGYCFLIDADLYKQHQLDEGHQWWWSITKIQAKLLNADLSVQAFANHEQWLHHFGGKSGDSWRGAKGMEITPEDAALWFNGFRAAIL
jgi:hypothetical protein